MTQMIEAQTGDVDPALDVVFGDVAEVAGQLAMTEDVIVEEPPVLYSYKLEYDDKGRFAYARSEDFRTGVTTRIRFEDGEPATTVRIDRQANTHDMTIHQKVGDVTFRSVYAGPEGWVGHAPNIARGTDA